MTRSRAQLTLTVRVAAALVTPPSKDLAGIGGKYDPLALQARWIYPRSARRGGNAADAAKLAPKVTVTLPSGEKVTGTLDRIDDFDVSLRDSEGRFHSFHPRWRYAQKSKSTILLKNIRKCLENTPTQTYTT